jgi:DNA-binding beta-propeller fold protein YncE
MKKTLLIFLGLAFLIFTNQGQTIKENSDGTNIKNSSSIRKMNNKQYYFDNAKIIHQVPSPVDLVLDITFDGKNLWITGYDEDSFYKINPIDGSILKKIPWNTNYIARGLTFDGKNLWVINSDVDLIYKIDTINGNIIETFNTPTIKNNYPAGLAWDGKFLWHIDAIDGNTSGNDSMRIFKLDTLLNILKFKTVKISGNGGGLTFANGNLWYTDNGSDTFSELDTTNFNVIRTIEAPGGNYPNGLAFDGQYLWLANADKDSLYQIDIGIIQGLKNIDCLNMFKIYPNPSIDKITIDFSETQNSNFTIFNTIGECLIQGELKGRKNEIDISSLPNGIYVIAITGKFGKMEQKLIKE